MGLKAVRIEFQRLLERSGSLVPPITARARHTTGSMSLCEIGVDRQGPVSVCQDVGDRDVDAVPRLEKGIARREAGIGARVERIKLDGPGEILLGHDKV